MFFEMTPEVRTRFDQLTPEQQQRTIEAAISRFFTEAVADERAVYVGFDPSTGENVWNVEGSTVRAIPCGPGCPCPNSFRDMPITNHA